MKTKDLDRLVNLGFEVNINWNKDISIHFPFFPDSDFTMGDGVFILIYIQKINSGVKFTKAIDMVLDEFNSWYLDNREYLDEYNRTNDPLIREKIIGMGDITSKIDRNSKIDDLFEDYDF